MRAGHPPRQPTEWAEGPDRLGQSRGLPIEHAPGGLGGEVGGRESGAAGGGDQTVESRRQAAEGGGHCRQAIGDDLTIHDGESVTLERGGQGRARPIFTGPVMDRIRHREHFRLEIHGDDANGPGLLRARHPLALTVAGWADGRQTPGSARVVRPLCPHAGRWADRRTGRRRPGCGGGGSVPYLRGAVRGRPRVEGRHVHHSEGRLRRPGGTVRGRQDHPAGPHRRSRARPVGPAPGRRTRGGRTGG